MQVLSVPRVMALTPWHGHCGGRGLQVLLESVRNPRKGLTGVNCSVEIRGAVQKEVELVS